MLDDFYELYEELGYEDFYGEEPIENLVDCQSKVKFVITSNGNNQGYCLCINENGRYIAPLFYSTDPNDKILDCYEIEKFNTYADAREYLDSHEGLIPDTWKICGYENGYGILECAE